MSADGLFKGLEGVGQIDRLCAYIGILPLQIADVQLNNRFSKYIKNRLFLGDFFIG